ncbi:MAG: CPBP family intramembrane metalloprotease [bacterium]|nr:CPBP family intramembrane metalloprotease [bacterium]
MVDIQDGADRSSDAYRAVTPRSEANRKAVVVLVTAALSLTILNFGATSEPEWFINMLDNLGLDAWARWARVTFHHSIHAQRNGLVFWGIGQLFAYTLPPLVAIRLILRERVSDYGLRVRGIGRHAAVYAVLLAVSVPFVWAASFTAAFQAKYPFYDLEPGEGLWPNMALWWLVYGLQFAALEFFFRGFMIHGLRGRLGYMAVFVMVVPYNMLHYGKPMAEALAAIVGGVVLGSLSLRSRSIWWGVVVHVAIAGTMDVAALFHKGFPP